MDKSTKCAKILKLGQNKVFFDIFVKFQYYYQSSCRSVVVIIHDFYMEGPWFDSRQRDIFYLHSNSAAKKTQNQIYQGRISHVYQKCVFTVPLQQKKYNIKFPQEEYTCLHFLSYSCFSITQLEQFLGLQE